MSKRVLTTDFWTLEQQCVFPEAARKQLCLILGEPPRPQMENFGLVGCEPSSVWPRGLWFLFCAGTTI